MQQRNPKEGDYKMAGSVLGASKDMDVKLHKHGRFQAATPDAAGIELVLQPSYHV